MTRRANHRVCLHVVLLLITCLLCEAAAARTVTDAQDRTVTVPAAAERVVALTGTDLDVALTLGVQPVGTLNGRGQSGPPRYLGDRAAGIPIVGNFPSPNLGRIIELDPDVILAGGLPDRQLLAQLERIAPTVATYALGEGWRQALARGAAALGREQERDAFLDRYREELAGTRRALCVDTESTVSIVRWSRQGPAFMKRDAFASSVLRDLGLRRPEGQREEGMGHSPPLSLEAIERIDADLIFLGTLRRDGQAAQALASVRDRPVFQRLGAVQRDQVAVVDGSLWTGLGGPAGALEILATVREILGGC